MGIGSKLKKAFKKSVKNMFRGGTAWGFVKKYVDKPFTEKLQSLFGVGAMKDMAAAQEAQLRQQTEAAKLNAMNEMGNVTQFSDNTAQFADFGDTSTNRRKKRNAGAFSSGIGLQV